MERRGGRLLAYFLHELQEAIGEYYGQLNEIRLGLTDEIPQKPEAMILYEQIQELGIPLVEGGVLDQPFIFMQEYRIVGLMIQQMKLVEQVQAQDTASDLADGGSSDDPLGLFSS